MKTKTKPSSSALKTKKIKLSEPPDDFGSARIYRVPSLEEAVDLAAKFKQEGRYDWFRGQSNDWPANPTLGRLDNTEFKKVRLRLERFRYWISKTPGLEKLQEDPYTFFAIAQHYGIPTQFLDFTTDPGVAGYFASTIKKKPRNEGCIFCLNTKSLNFFWKWLRDTLPHYPNIHFVRVRVPNLWRLEAQHGVFLFCPSNWETCYGATKIVFPASPPPAYPTHDEIYPQKRSQLELLLDHYFETDKIFQANEFMRSYFPEAKIFRITAPPKGYEEDYFVNGKLPLRSDWRINKLKNWVAIKKENFGNTVLGEIGLRISLKVDANDLRDEVAFGVRRVLEKNPNIRSRSVRWILLPQMRLGKRLTFALDWLWNGLRLLPYSDREIAEAVGLCFALHKIEFWNAKNSQEESEIIEKLLGMVTQVEFSSWDGAPSRAFVATSDLHAAVRPDITNFLRPCHRKYGLNVFNLLQLCHNPRRLFVFDKFTKLFATQIAPIQVSMPGAKASYFSPVRLKGFGLP